MVQIRWSRRIIAEVHEVREYLQAFSPRSSERLTDAIFGKQPYWKPSPCWAAWCPKPNGRMCASCFYQKYRLLYQVVSGTEMLMLTLHPALRPLAAGSLLE